MIDNEKKNTNYNITDHVFVMKIRYFTINYHNLNIYLPLKKKKNTCNNMYGKNQNEFILVQGN